MTHPPKGPDNPPSTALGGLLRPLSLVLCLFLLGVFGLGVLVSGWRAQPSRSAVEAPTPAPPRAAPKVPDARPAPAPRTAPAPLVDESPTTQHRAEVRDLSGQLVEGQLLLLSASCQQARSLTTPRFSQTLLPSERGCTFSVLYSHDGWSVASNPRTFDAPERSTVFVLPIETDTSTGLVVSRGAEGLGLVETTPDSLLSQLGLKPGDRITQVNGVSGGDLSVEELLQAFSLEVGERVTFTLARGEGDTAQEEIELRGLGFLE